MASKAQQLPLGVSLATGSTLADFYAPAQPEAYALIERLSLHADDPSACLWGGAGTGKTHLLQAACRAARGCGRSAAYLSLTQAATLDPRVLDGWGRYDLICIDDVHAIAGQRAWEVALFNVFNQLHEFGGTLIGACQQAPNHIDWAMADWRSRLTWGPVMQLAPLDDEALAGLLALRAQRSGLVLPEEVTRFILQHAPRDTATLMTLFAALDRASLTLKRRLTIPLVREVLQGIDVRETLTSQP